MELPKLLKSIGFEVEELDENFLLASIVKEPRFTLVINHKRKFIKEFKMTLKDLNCSQLFSTGKDTHSHEIMLIEILIQCIDCVDISNLGVYNTLNRALYRLAEMLESSDKMSHKIASHLARTKLFNYVRVEDNSVSFRLISDINVLVNIQFYDNGGLKALLYFNGEMQELVISNKIYKLPIPIITVILKNMSFTMKEDNSASQQFLKASENINNQSVLLTV